MTGRIVRLRAGAELSGPACADGTLVPVLFEYDPGDPLAVAIVLGEGDGAARWSAGRDLLHAGLTRRAGSADVTAWPAPPGDYCLRFDGGSGAGTFTLPATRIRKFLRRTFRLVPPGSEAYDMDAELAGLLRRDAA